MPIGNLLPINTLCSTSAPLTLNKTSILTFNLNLKLYLLVLRKILNLKIKIVILKKTTPFTQINQLLVVNKCRVSVQQCKCFKQL